MRRYANSTLATRSTFHRTAMRTRAVNVGFYVPRGGYRF